MAAFHPCKLRGAIRVVLIGLLGALGAVPTSRVSSFAAFASLLWTPRPLPTTGRYAASTATASSDSSPPSPPQFNFGAASSRDSVLFTVERPAHARLEQGGADGRGEDALLEEEVVEWIRILKGQHQISRVAVLLDPDELEVYPSPGLAELYRRHGLKCRVQPMRSAGAASALLAWIRDAEASGDRVAVHCTGGVGRCGRVAAAWLVERYGLSPADATDEVLRHAAACGVTRAGNPALLEEWLVRRA